MPRIKTCSLKSEYLLRARLARDNGEPVTPIVRAYANDLQVSMQAAYKVFKAEGLLGATKSGKPRKERSDKGTSEVAKSQTLNVASAVVKGRRKVAGKRGLPVKEAVEMLKAEGIIPEASLSTYYRQLKKHHLDKESLNAETPFVRQRSLCPGDVYQIDASQALQWYLYEKKLILDPEKAAAEYKIEKRREECLKRYICVDHFSSAFWVMYAYAKGENMRDYLRAFWEACRWKGDDFLLSGLPRMALSDGGSPLASKGAQNAFAALGVQYHSHLKGNPRAKGSVESRHGWWEAKFEAKLIAMGITHFTLDELNEMAFQQCKLWNEENVNARTGMSPFELWRRWNAANPDAAASRRYPPDDWELMEELAKGIIYDGKIFPDWTIRFKTCFYDVSRLREYDEIQPRKKIAFCRDPKNPKNIIIDTPDGLRHVIAPIILGMDGMPVDAPVIGMEYKSKPDDMATKARKEALAAPIPQPPHDDKIIKVSFVKSGDGAPSHSPLTGQGGEVEITAPARMVSRFEWIEQYAQARKCDLRNAADEYRSRYGDAESAPLNDIEKPSETDSETNNQKQKGD